MKAIPIPEVKSFFSSFGSKIKNFVTEEQKAISKFLTDSGEQRSNSTNQSTGELLPPWLDIPTDDPEIFSQVKNQILGLTKSRRNFLNAPPDDVHFAFNFDEILPVAMLSLKVDPALSQARFYLVPKCILHS
jgi:hypothetical protein